MPFQTTFTNQELSFFQEFLANTGLINPNTGDNKNSLANNVDP